MELPDSSMNRLKELKDKTEAISYAEVTKNAYRIYERIIELSENGSKFMVQDPDGKTREVEFFL